jgi:hypothetical protein
VFAFAQPARAQETVFGAYCGEVTWQGQAPVDSWIIFLTENRWSAPLTAGPFTDATDGTRTQNGTMLTMRSTEAPYYSMNASAANGRIVGEVSANDGRRGTISLSQMTGTGAGLRSSSLPPDFAPDAAREAIAGDIEGVQRAVTWAWTPQGSTYWRSVYQSGRLPDHAADALRDWLRRYDAGETPACDAQ